MKYRKLGKTGIEVSEIGFGAWQLGNTVDWDGATDREAIQLVHEAIDRGCNFFDTAPNYAGGRSEELLGKALKEKRDKVVISTKFGHFPDGSTNYDAGLLRKSVENSLQKLNTDYLDCILLHSPPFELLTGETPHFEIMAELKKEGKVRAYGASVDSSQELESMIDNSEAEVAEILFNLFYQEPKKAFKQAEEGVGLICKVPLDSGWLTGKYDASSTFTGIRSRWSREDIVRRAELVNKVREIKPAEVSMVHEALAFILKYKEISTVIPGVRNLKQLKDNLQVVEVNMPDERWKQYEEFYKKYIAGQELPW